MDKFTYTELETFTQNLNDAKINISIIEDLMHGAFPDNEASADLVGAAEQTALLILDAEYLLKSIAALIKHTK